jgi:hypothetical protein
LQEINDQKVLQNFVRDQIRQLHTDPTKHGAIIEPLENQYGLLLWDPAGHYKKNVVCPLHNLVLSLTDKWALPGNDRISARTLYHLGRNVFLVSRLYKCPNCREPYKAHHEELSAQLDRVHVPFVLFQRSGYTTKAFDLIIKLVETGKIIVEFPNIQLLIQAVWIAVSRCCSAFHVMPPRFPIRPRLSVGK